MPKNSVPACREWKDSSLPKILLSWIKTAVFEVGSRFLKMLRVLPHFPDTALGERDSLFGELVFGIELGVDFGDGPGSIDVGATSEILKGAQAQVSIGLS